MRFRRRPVLVDAVQWTGWNWDELEAFAPGVLRLDAAEKAVFVATLEGPIRADPGHWIVRGVKGEHWPVRDDVFQEAYEPL